MRPVLPALVALAALCGVAPAQVTFENVVVETNTSFPSYGRGAAMVDFDKDGRLDVAAAVALDPTRVWRQLPDHTFEDVTAAWGLPDQQLKTWTMVAGDFDEDADPDLFLANGGFYWDDQPNTLLRNDVPAGGGFTDVSASSTLDVPVGKTFGATALDHDRDGDLDLFWCDNGGLASYLFRNDGGLVFTDVSVEAGVAVWGGYRHASSGDYNNDGWPDIVCGNGNGPPRLWRNNQNGTFSDLADFAGLGGIEKSFGAVLQDFDNDGWQDVFVPIYQAQTITTTSRVLMNQGDGTFTDVSADTVITGQTDMGHNVGDLDADGYPDIYIGTGHPMFASLDILYLVTPDGSGGVVLDDVSVESGITVGGTETRCHGMAMGDYDEDGDVDVYVNNGGPSINPATAEENFFLRSTGNANGWLKVDPRGVLSPRTPVGLRGVVTTSTGRDVWRMLTAGKGFGNTDAPILHFGLGTDPGVERLELIWPSGVEQVLLGVGPQDEVLVIETGMRLRGEPALGATVELDVAGPDGHAVTLWTAGGTIEAPLPKFGGVLYLAPPLLLLFSGTTDSQGELTLPLAIPDTPVLSGVDVPLQSWIRPAAAADGGVLSNLVELAIP